MKKHVEPIALDSFDRKILEVLQAEGRISNQALAERVNLSPSPCLRRVRALESAGLITGYQASIDHHKLGYGLDIVVLISMNIHTPEAFERLEKQVAELPEVRECLLITGQEADYLLRITAVDMDDYQRLLLGHITRIPGVSGVHSSFVLHSLLGDRVIEPPA